MHPLSLSFALAFQTSATQSAAPPSGAVVLFGGTDTSSWRHRGTDEGCKWEVVGDSLVVTPGTPDIVSKQKFGDYLLHLEFWLPPMKEAEGQARANSGVYNHGRYEVQILDSFENPTYAMGGCGAIYGQKDPDRDAIRPPGQWNTYDITFRAPRFDNAGAMTAKPRITVVHNGTKIHDDVEIEQPFTAAGLSEGPQPPSGPILLQNHGDRVRFRNVWVLPLPSPAQSSVVRTSVPEKRIEPAVGRPDTVYQTGNWTARHDGSAPGAQR